MAARKYNHFTFEDRVRIEEGLNRSCSLADISRRLACHPTSLAREIVRNVDTQGYRRKSRGLFTRPCIHKSTCNKVKVCKRETQCGSRLCKRCNAISCTDECDEFSEVMCRHLKRASSTCNGCNTSRHCYLSKRSYRAKVAQSKYEARSLEAKRGIHTTEEEFSLMCAAIAEGLDKNQSLHHIYASNPTFYCSERNLYRLIEKGTTSPYIIALDLPKAVKYKKQTSDDSSPAFCVPERSYSDFLELDEFSRTFRVEMDVVEGRSGSTKVVLILYIPVWKFLFARLLDNQTSECVVDALDELETLIGQKCFRDYFSVCLTDRGTEFSDYLSFERSALDDQAKRMHVYYCDPRRPDQKGSIEKGHVEFRKKYPKGTSFDLLTQGELDEALLHINSQVRRSLSDRTPIDLLLENFPKRSIKRLGLKKIQANQVNLRAWIEPREN